MSAYDDVKFVREMLGLPDLHLIVQQTRFKFLVRSKSTTTLFSIFVCSMSLQGGLIFTPEIKLLLISVPCFIVFILSICVRSKDSVIDGVFMQCWEASQRTMWMCHRT